MAGTKTYFFRAILALGIGSARTLEQPQGLVEQMHYILPDVVKNAPPDPGPAGVF
jgi:hypothetical protein